MAGREGGVKRSDRVFYTAVFVIAAVCLLGAWWAQRRCDQRGGIALRSAFALECVSRDALLPVVQP